MIICDVMLKYFEDFPGLYDEAVDCVAEEVSATLKPEDATRMLFVVSSVLVLPVIWSAYAGGKWVTSGASPEFARFGKCPRIDFCLARTTDHFS